MDSYLLSHIDKLVDSTSRHEVLVSLMNSLVTPNQKAEDDQIKTSFMTDDEDLLLHPLHEVKVEEADLLSVGKGFGQWGWALICWMKRGQDLIQILVDSLLMLNEPYVHIFGRFGYEIFILNFEIVGQLLH